MKRWTVRILVCLVLGAVVNVAVAWGLVMSSTPEFGDWTETLDDPAVEEIWDRYLPEDRDPAVFIRELARSSTVIGVDEVIQFDRMEWHGPFLALRIVSSGLPLRSMRYHYWVQHIASLDVLGYEEPRFALGWPGDQVAGGHTHRVDALPLRPIWPGFLINTAIYAVVAWMLFFFGPGQVRRANRRARGRCVSCGYDLRGNSGGGCPECGWGREAGSAS